ncbi:MAG: hypothetical protein AAGD32_02670 [Planctomycetota bacterium]
MFLILLVGLGVTPAIFAGPVSTSPPAVIVDQAPSDSPYRIAAPALTVGATPVSVPMQLQQPRAEAALAMAKIEARQNVSVLALPDASTGLQLPSAYQRAAADAVSYVDLSADAEAPRPVVPLPAGAWGGLATVTLLVGVGWLRKHHRPQPRLARVRR